MEEDSAGCSYSIMGLECRAGPRECNSVPSSQSKNAGGCTVYVWALRVPHQFQQSSLAIN
ncbi:hypothetical protein J6590_083633 [Homalodisca vitripennis]|nr:hypothetical protein J6590_083633 [Homalodisca vitripennis]